MLLNMERERKKRGISKKDLSFLLGVSRVTYNNWISERTDIPGRKLYDMSMIFGVGMEHLIENREWECGKEVRNVHQLENSHHTGL